MKRNRMVIQNPDETDGLPVLISAKDCADRIGTISEERLVELARGGYMPCWWVDDLPPMFRLADVKRYLRKHLTRVQHGRPVAEVLGVQSPISYGGPVPPTLLPMASRLVRLSLPGVAGLSGVYFLARGGAVVYVGQSNNVGARLAQHLGEAVKDFDAAWFVPVALSDLDAVEGAFIRLLQPPLNGTPPIGERPRDSEVVGAFGMRA